MRVRTATAEVHKASGLTELFSLAKTRHLAWLRGDGHIYADLEKVAAKAGFRVWSYVVPEESKLGTWFAVREDLIAEDGWNATDESLSFVASKDGLGEVGLVGEHLFDRRTSVTVLMQFPEVTHTDFTYNEVLYSASARKD